MKRLGWLVPAKGNVPSRVYFPDQESVAAPAATEIENVDFIALCRDQYLLKKEVAPKTFNPLALKTSSASYGKFGYPDTVQAAWLWRLGEMDLASRALKAARSNGVNQKDKSDDVVVRQLRHTLATHTYDALLNAFAAGADTEAMEHGERFLRLYQSDIVKLPTMKQGQEIVDDLKRREKAGTFDKKRRVLPADFDAWVESKKVGYLIDVLDDVAANSSTSRVDFFNDERVTALFRLGDAAVPSLIEVAAKDGRLTRTIGTLSVSGAADGFTYFGIPELIQTRNVAMVILAKVLQLDVYTTDPKGIAPWELKSLDSAEMGRSLQALWPKIAKSPIDVRMYDILTDPQTSYSLKRPAMEFLVPPAKKESNLENGKVKSRPLSPYLLSDFQNPTVAEAIVAAFDGELAQLESQKGKQQPFQPGQPRPETERDKKLERYLNALSGLGDKRIAAECVRRAESAPDLATRVQWIPTCCALGQQGPLSRFVKEFTQGSLPGAERKPGTRVFDTGTMTSWIAVLLKADASEREAALFSLLNPAHPYHESARFGLLYFSSSVHLWYTHPFAHKLLGLELGNKEETKTFDIIQNTSLQRNGGYFSSGGTVPSGFGDRLRREEKVFERVCDSAALELQSHILGMAPFHPLLKDADDQLKAYTSFYRRFEDRLRVLTSQEKAALGIAPGHVLLVPNLPRLTEAADVDDVLLGRAIFFNKGGGQLADLKLPAVATYKNDTTTKKVLILQAEVGLDGVTYYGIVGPGIWQKVWASDLTALSPIEDKR